MMVKHLAGELILYASWEIAQLIDLQGHKAYLFTYENISHSLAVLQWTHPQEAGVWMSIQQRDSATVLCVVDN